MNRDNKGKLKEKIENNNNIINNKNNNSGAQKPKTKIWLQILLVVVIMVAVVATVFSFGDLSEILNTLSTVKLNFVIIAIITSLLGWVIFSFAGYVPLVTIHPKVNKVNAYLINMTEPFFNGITPFGAGSQPFQIYYMVREGVEGNKATSVTMVNFVIYQTIISILAIITLGLYYPEISEAMGSSIALLFIGFGINTAILVFFMVLTLIKGSHQLFENIIKLFSRFKFMEKHTDKWLITTKSFIINFQEGFKFLMGKKRVFLLSVILKLLGLITQYATVILLALSLGHSLVASEYIYLVLISMLSFTVMMWVPLPGSSGGIEWIFTILVTPLFINSGTIFSLLLLWRLATYYFPLLFGGVGYLTLVRRGRMTEK